MNDIRDYLAKLGRKGGKATAAKRTKEERSAAARKAVQARWEKTLSDLEAKQQRKSKGKKD